MTYVLRREEKFKIHQFLLLTFRSDPSWTPALSPALPARPSLLLPGSPRARSSEPAQLGAGAQSLETALRVQETYPETAQSPTPRTARASVPQSGRNSCPPDAEAAQTGEQGSRASKMTLGRGHSRCSDPGLPRRQVTV